MPGLGGDRIQRHRADAAFDQHFARRYEDLLARPVAPPLLPRRARGGRRALFGGG